mgnify:CR=1 FL=1
MGMSGLSLRVSFRIETELVSLDLLVKWGDDIEDGISGFEFR